MRVAALLFLTGCSSSLLIRAGDPVFRDAQAGLIRTAARIEAAPEAERALFMQAEGFYRYRFEFPRRSFGVHLAQIAAVTVELPALQALAGSLDLVDLRLKMSDAAVQLWETLLLEHPGTTLRPLTLYRLGWAYRSVGVSGFPRESGDEAFDVVAREQPGTPLAALALDAKRSPWKSKDTATGWSILPGLGQMYVGEYANGGARLAIALAAMAMIITPIAVAYSRRDDLSWGRDWPLLATGLGGLIVLSIDYTLAYQDVMRGVVQFNERAESAFASAHPDGP